MGGSDTQVHSATHVESRHERVQVCEACESAPSVLARCADAVAQCTTCDAEMHSANALAQRHRIPVLPLPVASGFMEEEAAHGSKEEEVNSRLLLSRGSVDRGCTDSKSNNKHFECKNYSRFRKGIERRNRVSVTSQVATASQQHQSGHGILGIQHGASMTTGISDYTSFNGTFSSTEVGIVPGNTITDIPNTNIPTTIGAMDRLIGHSLQMPVQFSSMDREARILRYKEKKWSRKFDIRYASRKAYAEAHPQIKGRFTKRSDIELQVDQMFSSPTLTEDRYGNVPWF